MKNHLLALIVVVAAASLGVAQENPVTPYVDPSQLEIPGQDHSFYKQPWRAFLETRSGDGFLHGIGINYNVPGEADDLAVRLLAESGFKTFRIEIGWDSVAWDETHLNNEKRIHHLMELCKQYDIRPTLLLNANHGAPCPTQQFEKRLAEDAPKGSRTVKFTDNTRIEVGHSGISRLSSSAAAEAIIIAIDPKTGECQLSKPLPKALSRDKPIPMATIKYLPLFPVGTKEYEETAAGWIKYAKLVADQPKAAGIEDFDLELWNELSFGSNFVHAKNYFDPEIVKETKDFLHEGGTCWELAQRTIEAIRPEHPHCHFIWGFSNTTFFHCAVPQLPPGMDGQSYHPYGTGTRSYPKDEDLPKLNFEGFTPTMEVRMPEGWAHEFWKTECLMKLLNPKAREAHPPGTEHFHHYMTEHGVAPAECGIHDEAGAWEIKTKCALRSYCLWMNKGIDGIDYFCAYEKDPMGMGLMPPNLVHLPVKSVWDYVATPPMTAIRNLTRAFAGAKPMESTQAIGVEVTELGEPRKVFEGDAKHPPLWQREAFAVLPFQVDQHKWVIAAYAMTFDATKPFPPQSYRLKLSGFGPGPLKAHFYDPIRGADFPIKATDLGNGTIEVEIPAVDYPRLLLLE